MGAASSALKCVRKWHPVIQDALDPVQEVLAGR